QKMEEHLRAQEGIDIFDGEIVIKAEKISGGFKITSESGKILETKTILVCSGSGRRKLGVPGEKQFDGKGVAYCATCDAPLFKDKSVAVIGSGNSGLEAAQDLLNYAGKIYILEFLDAVKGDTVTLEKLIQSGKAEVITSAQVQEIFGGDFVEGVKYLDKKSGVVKELKLQGVFVEIGAVPNVEFLGDLVQKNKLNEVVIDCSTQKTSESGIWAAGDVSSVLYKQNNIAAGDAIKAVLNIYDYLIKPKTAE
ncbi:MAG: alkyl hydroperoxide reductase subunit F, partial [Parcubacteria group bacterium Athens0714_26]